MDKPKSKGRPKGPAKVAFFRRVLPSTVPKLEEVIRKESLGHAASVREPPPSAIRAQEVVAPIPTPAPKVESGLKAKETPSKGLPEVRPNYFKKP